MKYLVVIEPNDVTVAFNPEQTMEFMNRIVKSLEMVIKMEKEKRIIAGGVNAGGKGGVAIVEANSHEECSNLITSLPFWTFLNWKVTPLESYENRLKEVRKMMENMKKK